MKLYKTYQQNRQREEKERTDRELIAELNEEHKSSVIIYEKSGLLTVICNVLKLTGSILLFLALGGGLCVGIIFLLQG